MLLPVLLLACGDDTEGADAALADARPPDATTCTGSVSLRVMTWNVHDLFDEYDDSGKSDDILTTAEANAKVADVAVVINAVDADVALLQEVENRLILQRLADATGFGNVYIVEAYDPRGIDVAVMSKIPLSRYASHLGDRNPLGDYTWSRDCTEAYLTVNCRQIVLQNNHFIAQSSGSDDETRRTYGSDQLDYLLVHPQSTGFFQSASIRTGTDVNNASDHRPIVANFTIPAP